MIEYELQDQTAWITLDRPKKMNAIHAEGWSDLCNEIERAEHEARSVVVTGVEDVFSAGNDISDVNNVLEDGTDQDEIEARLERTYKAFDTIESVGIPVIAAVNGKAYGGGCELAAASDLAVAEEGTEFALPETRIGAYPSYSVERVAAIAGRKRMMELMLTGEPIDATTAAEWGLINRVVQRGRLSKAVTEYTAAIERSPKPATKLIKRTVNTRLRNADEFQKRVEAAAYLRQACNQQETIKSFLNE